MRIQKVILTATAIAAVVVPAGPARAATPYSGPGHHGHHSDSDGYGYCSYHYCRHYPYGHRERTRHRYGCDEGCG